jgi:hypothetical protein
MKRFLTHILFFLLLFFTVEKALYYFIQNAPKKEYDKRLELVLQGEMEKDIVIIGSSRGANNIVAKQLEDETGLSTHNLSYRGSNIIFHQFILETLLLYNKKPQKVLLVIDDEYEFVKDYSLHFRFDRLYPLKKYSYINDKLIALGKKSYLSKFLNSAQIDKEDFSLKSKRIYPMDLMTTHGSKLLPFKVDNDVEFLNESKNYNTSKEQSSKLECFIKIQEMCSINGIELHFIFTPNYSKSNNEFYKRFELLVLDGLPIYRYDQSNADYYKSDHFYDTSHLNQKGAKIFTSELSQYINSWQ